MSLPGGEVGTSYSQTLTASGGITPYSWSISSGLLPAGLSLNAKSGAITGTPSAAGTSSFTVKVTDSSTPTPLTATANLSITVTQPTYATSLARYENGEVKLSGPNGVAVEQSSGNFWVSESAQDRVLEFNPARKYLRQFGEEGSGQGQFKGIGGIATNSSGDLYVIDTGNGRVQEFSPEGKYITQFATPNANAIAVDSEGNVWVDEWGVLSGSRLAEYSSSGTFKSQFGSAGSAPGQLGLASGLSFSGGHLYIAELGRVQEFSSTGEYIRQFDNEPGAGNGQSSEPWGIATNPATGNLYVSEFANNRVQEFSPEGNFITTFGAAGSGPGQFSHPEGLAISSSGTIYIADSANNRVQEWAPAKGAGEPPTYATSLTRYENGEVKLSGPNGVAVEQSSGNFWVSESAQDRVLEFNPARKYLRQFGEEGSGQGQFKGIGGIATNSSGDLYVIDTGNGRVQEFSPEGKYITQFATPNANAIAVDSEGNVWVDEWGVLSGSRLAEYSSSGTFKSQFGSAGSAPGQLGLASGLSFSGGHLYVAELGRVQEFSSTGEYIRQFDNEPGAGNGQSSEPWGIATNPATGNLYVSEFANNRVQEFSPEGNFITTFGAAGSGPGQFSHPEGLTISSSGTIYIADSANNRVQEWADGALEASRD